MLDQFNEVLARGWFAAGEMNLQHAYLGELGQNLLPFGRRQFAGAAIELHWIRTIRALQRAAMGHLSQHSKRNAISFRRRTRPLQRCETVLWIILGTGRNWARIGQGWAHGVFSRASVRKPL